MSGRCAILLLSLLIPAASRADEDPDLSRYDELLELVERAQEALRDASDGERAPRREAAVAAHAELLAWLEAFVRTDQYTTLDSETRTLVQRDLDTAGVSLTRLRAEAGDCAGALDELDAAVARTDTAERRRFVQSSGADLGPCPTQGWLALETEPHGAEAHLDGVLLGPASGRYRVAAGSHMLRLAAAEREAVELSIEAEPGAELALGPLTLLPVGPARDVEPLEWTLWAVGAVGVGVGVGYLVFAENRQAELNDLEDRGAVIVDREGEVETNRGLRRLGGAALGVGLLAGTLGTVLYLTRRAGAPEPDTAFEVRAGPQGLDVRLGWRF